MARTIHGCVVSACAPKLSWPIDMTPVDYCCDAICAVCIKLLEGERVSVYRLQNQDSRMMWELWEFLQSFGYDLEVADYEVWRRQVLADCGVNPRHPLYSLHHVFAPQRDAMGAFKDFPIFDNQRAVELLQKDCPPVTEGLLEMYFKELVEAGHLPAPKGRVDFEIVAMSSFELL